MSTTTATTNVATTDTISSSPPASAAIFTSIGLGYAIAIALGFLVLISTILLLSYCCRRRRNSRLPLNPNPNPNVSSDGGLILPRVIFLAEDDDDQNSEIHVTGLDRAIINSYPKFPFLKSKDGIHHSSCSICLCDYKDGEMLRMMPDCRHLFHLLCLDAWLRLNGSCPVCRNSPLPTPLSTPLSEVVPLSQYSGGGRTRR